MNHNNNDLLVDLREKANQRPYLYHYTKFGSLIKIIDGNSLRLSRIDKVNDQVESKRITTCWKDKIFLLCFTYTTSNEDYYFDNYGKIRLKIENGGIDRLPIFYDEDLRDECKTIIGNLRDLPGYYDENYTGDYTRSKADMFLDNNDWQIYDKTFADVFYCDDINTFYTIEGFEKHAGLIKQKVGTDTDGKVRNWEVEMETRLRLTMETIHYDAYNDQDKESGESVIRYAQPPFAYLYMPLPKIEEISLSPDISETERKEVEDFLREKGLINLLK